MLKRKRFWAYVLVPLYAVTWAGGWNSHARQVQHRAERGYQAAQQFNEELEAQSRKDGTPYHHIELRKGGPTSHVYWCAPVLPGVLLADSDYCVGPLHAGGGLKIVLWYGFGSWEIWTPWCWLA
jgi:hypothetical protein